MDRFSKCFWLLISIAVTVSCTSNSKKLDGYKVKLWKENVSGLVHYDTAVSLDYLTEESKKVKDVTNFEFFDHFDYPQLKNILETSTHLILFNDSIRISIKLEPVDSLQYERNIASDSNYYTNAFGLAEHQFLPSHQISSITIRINDKVNEIPRREYENMFDPNIAETEYHIPTKAYVTEAGEIILQMDNSGGADFYYLIFLFDKFGKLEKRIVKNVI